MPLEDLLRTADLTPGDLRLLLDRARAFREAPYRSKDLLRNDTVLLYFGKPSTRTRLSLETAVARLGGTPMMVGHDDLQIGRGETIEDTARVVSRYARAVAIRTFRDEEVVRFAAAATVPVVNALTDSHHPCQSLADLLTVETHLGPLPKVHLAYVGDGTNVLHSLIEAAALTGMRLSVATPPGYEPDPGVVVLARRLAEGTGARIDVGHDAWAAVAGADAVYTDTWFSMGHGAEGRAARMDALRTFQVTEELMAHAGDQAIFLHCLPDHRGEEVTAEVVDGRRSVVFEQAGNRLPTELAVLECLLEGALEGDPSWRVG